LRLVLPLEKQLGYRWGHLLARQWGIQLVLP
jgi:hypothetical protein